MAYKKRTRPLRTIKTLRRVRARVGTLSRRRYSVARPKYSRYSRPTFRRTAMRSRRRY